MPAGSFNKPMCLEIIDHGVSRYIIWPILSCTVRNSSALWFGNLKFSSVYYGCLFSRFIPFTILGIVIHVEC